MNSVFGRTWSRMSQPRKTRVDARTHMLLIHERSWPSDGLLSEPGRMISSFWYGLIHATSRRQIEVMKKARRMLTQTQILKGLSKVEIPSIELSVFCKCFKNNHFVEFYFQLHLSTCLHWCYIKSLAKLCSWNHHRKPCIKLECEHDPMYPIPILHEYFHKFTLSVNRSFGRFPSISDISNSVYHETFDKIVVL
jgi:hypothetical protein